jgi:hypothetical protein
MATDKNRMETDKTNTKSLLWLIRFHPAFIRGQFGFKQRSLCSTPAATVC